MRKLSLIFAVLLVASGCTPDPSAPQTRTVLIDYSHDEFASFFLEYFPRSVTLRPGDTVEFKQTWTGEPHSVTMGTLVDHVFEFAKPFIQKIRETGEEPQDPAIDEEFSKRMKPLPWMVGEEEHNAAQNGAQPCFLDEGVPPTDPETPCTDQQQKQPAFNGRQSYYNSGFIPYEGEGGNKFTIKLAEDIQPGTYNYYCNLHGPLMSGDIVVKPKGTEIPLQSEINQAARKQIEEISNPLRDVFNQARRGRLEPPDEAKELLLQPGEKYFKGNLAGLFSIEDQNVHGGINEFIPRNINAKVGEKVTWVVLGGHTISFDVPKYFPIISIQKDGTVVRNPRLDAPAGGSPPPPEQSDQPPEAEGDQPPEAEGEGPPAPTEIDAGTWDGSGFWSSGMLGGDPFALYSLRFSKPGRYTYACLIHPPMIGTVVVT